MVAPRHIEIHIFDHNSAIIALICTEFDPEVDKKT